MKKLTIQAIIITLITAYQSTCPMERPAERQVPLSIYEINNDSPYEVDFEIEYAGQKPVIMAIPASVKQTIVRPIHSTFVLPSTRLILNVKFSPQYTEHYSPKIEGNRIQLRNSSVVIGVPVLIHIAPNGDPEFVVAALPEPKVEQKGEVRRYSMIDIPAAIAELKNLRDFFPEASAKIEMALLRLELFEKESQEFKALAFLNAALPLIGQIDAITQDESLTTKIKDIIKDTRAQYRELVEGEKPEAAPEAGPVVSPALPVPLPRTTEPVAEQVEPVVAPKLTAQQRQALAQGRVTIKSITNQSNDDATIYISRLAPGGVSTRWIAVGPRATNYNIELDLNSTRVKIKLEDKPALELVVQPDKFALGLENEDRKIVHEISLEQPINIVIEETGDVRFQEPDIRFMYPSYETID